MARRCHHVPATQASTIASRRTSKTVTIVRNRLRRFDLREGCCHDLAIGYQSSRGILRR